MAKVGVGSSVKTNWHIATAAEAIVAAQFARLGFDVSVQYGANQPEYDLIVSRGDSIMKVSVKGSQDGGWGLTQSLKKGTTYHGAVDAWLKRHKAGTVICLVQFKAVGDDEMPRIYLATPKEIADQLKAARGGLGYTSLRENHAWKTGRARGKSDRIPNDWRFSQNRIEQLLSRQRG